MKVAIHHRQGSFSDGWIDFCKKKGVDYKIVNAFDSNIIKHLEGCDVMIWHHHQGHFKDVLTAKRILFSLEHSGIKVFPDFKTGWHFDDKVAQKYLLEAIGAPLVPSYVFYDKKEALNWAKNTSYPKVFKLKGGAGAANVRLVENYTEAVKLIIKSFGRGFPQFDRLGNLKERFRKFKNGQDTLAGLAKGIARLAIPTEFAKRQGHENGYAYFQDFIPDNSFDVRVVVIAGKVAVAEKRFVRENDFRASGSGEFSYENINLDIIKTSFYVATKLGLQSVAFDFVLNSNNTPLIVEISYGFGTDGISKAPGFWDENMNWHDGKFNPEELILMNIISGIG